MKVKAISHLLLQRQQCHPEAPSLESHLTLVSLPKAPYPAITLGFKDSTYKFGVGGEERRHSVHNNYMLYDSIYITFFSTFLNWCIIVVRNGRICRYILVHAHNVIILFCQYPFPALPPVHPPVPCLYSIDLPLLFM